MWCANTFSYRVKLNKYTAKVLGSKPEGLISFDKGLTSEQEDQVVNMFEKKTQGDNLGRVPVVSGGARYVPFMLNPDSVQMIESSDMSDERIMGIFRIPPTVIQRYKDSAFKGPAQQDTVYLKYTLTPIMKVIEQECNYKLFQEANKISKTPLYTKFNVKEMLRGSIKEQGEWYRLLISLGIASFNEVREMEDMPPLPNGVGDMHIVQGAFVPLEDLRGFHQGEKLANPDALRQIGLDYLKQAIERTEILNEHT
jgi:HK97 family phage portal protein